MNNATKISQPKADRFHRVAEKRVDNVLNALRLLRQCSNRRTYEYTDEEVQRMFREIEGELRSAKKSFDFHDKMKGFKF